MSDITPDSALFSPISEVPISEVPISEVPISEVPISLITDIELSSHLCLRFLLVAYNIHIHAYQRTRAGFLLPTLPASSAMSYSLQVLYEYYRKGSPPSSLGLSIFYDSVTVMIKCDLTLNKNVKNSTFKTSALILKLSEACLINTGGSSRFQLFELKT
jgi:hypothetical protein